MKKCPQCGTQYADVTLSFCLHDGTPLVVEPQTDTPTVVMGETETVVPRRDAAWDQSQVTKVAAGSAKQRSGSNIALTVGLTAIGMLVLFGIIGLAALAIKWKWDRDAANNANVNPDTNSIVQNSNPTPGRNPNSAPSPAQTTQITPPSSSPRPSPATTPAESQMLSSYPSITRLRFARGAYTTSFSGDLNPRDNRSLVLACRSGQSLSATITSGASCVSIRGGDRSYRIDTRGGDNYIVVNNNCSSGVRFGISITIL